MNIYILGKMASGKTTMANMIVDKFPNFKRVSLAEPIKNIVYNIDNMGDDELIKKFITPYYYDLDSAKRAAFSKILFETRYIPKDNNKERKRLQFLGTEGGRNRIDINIWVTILINKYKNGDYVVDDCRFKNESEAFFKNEWTPIFLLASEVDRIARIKKLYGEDFDISVLKHASETELDQILIPTKAVINSMPKKEDTFNNLMERLNIS